jgi:hypothetical protein
MDCVVRDISATGARLRVPDSRAVPEQFELLLKQTGEYRPAFVRWRRKGEVGVSFQPERRAFGRRPEPPSVDPARGKSNFVMSVADLKRQAANDSSFVRKLSLGFVSASYVFGQGVLSVAELL